MNLQDFACAVSELIWGGDLGWDRENGLEELFAAVKRYVMEGRSKTAREAEEHEEWRNSNDRNR